MTTVAEVRLWGRTIGAVSLAAGETVARFEYTSEFAASGIQPAPLTMPLSRRVYSFPELGHECFHGLPGLLADSLPDRFGQALVNAWLATQGRPPDSLNAVERLCYTGRRGMGALEFEPATGPDAGKAAALEVGELVRLASDILTRRNSLATSFALDGRERAMRDILRVGTSAGGARAKALIAWNRETKEVRSGQLHTGPGFEHWLLKFDGVTGNRDRELDDPAGFGAVEYAYALMAQAAGIYMSECRLFEEGGRRHFMTRRFDRRTDGEKIHMQSLGAMAHFDYNLAGAWSYEQALATMRRLDLPADSLEEQFRRMVFNIMARNQDDHVKNIAFLMDKSGRWSLAPAFDLTYSYNPQGDWTAAHQMTLNGKRDEFKPDDFEACARTASLQQSRARHIVREVADAVKRWPEFANEAGIPAATRNAIHASLRLDLTP